jgi:hypothetical protein
MTKKHFIKAQIITGTVVFVMIFLIGMVVNKRAYQYPYNVKADYQYEFSPTDAKIYKNTINDNKIDLSKVNKRFNTAFIEVEIRSNIAGWVFQPEISMNAGDVNVFHNLECRTKGKRYINISQFVENNANSIEIGTSGCNITSDSIRLICYENNIEAPRILILSPHPDDAEISAYGLYASHPDKTFIATITAGDAGSMRYDELYSDSTIHYIKKGKVRTWNSITIPMLGGVAPENAINLGYFDASLKKMYDDTLTLAKSRYIDTTDIGLFRSDNCTHLPDSLSPSSTWRSLVNDIKFLLLKHKPDVIISVYPKLDYHYDHKYTTAALAQAMNESNYTSCKIWLCTNHLPLTTMYPDGKIGSAISLPPYFDNEPIYFDRICSFPLTPKLQSDKILALDAMNDLRPDTQYRNTRASWLQFKQNLFDKLYLRESDYFRRSARSNELFFVIDGENFIQPDIQDKLFEE